MPGPSSPTTDDAVKQPPTLGRRILSLGLWQLAFNAMAIGLIALSVLLLDTLGMYFGLLLLIPLIGAQFLVFPALVGHLPDALGFIQEGEELGEFWYLMILGFGLLIWVFPSVPQGLDAWRLWRSHEVSADNIAEILRHGDQPVVFDLPDFRMLTKPLGRYVRRSRSDEGRVRTTSYTVVPLVPANGEADPRLWLGWKNLLVDSAQAGYFRVNPWNDNEYRQAVENALGVAPGSGVMILERTPDLVTAQEHAWGWLRFGFWLANGLSVGALLAIHLGLLIHRLRKPS